MALKNTLKRLGKFGAIGLTAGLLSFHGTDKARSQSSIESFNPPALETIKESRAGKYILNLAKNDFGINSNDAWNTLDYDRNELTGMLENARKENNSELADSIKRQISFRDSLEKKGVLQVYDSLYFKLPDEARDSLEVWKKDYARKTGILPDKQYMRQILHRTPEEIQNHIDSLKKLVQKVNTNSQEKTRIDARLEFLKKIKQSEIDKVYNSFRIFPNGKNYRRQPEQEMNPKYGVQKQEIIKTSFPLKINPQLKQYYKKKAELQKFMWKKSKRT